MQKINIDKPTFSFIIIAIVLLIELFIIFPWEISKMGGLTKKQGKLIEKINSIENEWPKKDKYLDSKEKLKEEIGKIRGKFITPNQESKILSFISSSSKKFGIEINSLIPEALSPYITGDVGNFKYLPIKVKAKGNFHNLAMFIDYLNSSQYFFEVKKLSMKSSLSDNIIEMVICGAVILE